METEVLSSSRRRCSICFGLNRDLETKQGQIAHLDRKRENHRIDNLVFLCLPHHDQYDSSTSQSKSFKSAEVKKYRQELYNHLNSQFDLDGGTSREDVLDIFYDDANTTCKRDLPPRDGEFVQRLWRVGVTGSQGKLSKGVTVHLDATDPHIHDLPGVLHPFGGEGINQPEWPGDGSFDIRPGETRYVEVIRYQPIREGMLWITFQHGNPVIGRLVTYCSYTLHLTARDIDGNSKSASFRLEIGDGIPNFSQISDSVVGS